MINFSRNLLKQLVKPWPKSSIRWKSEKKKKSSKLPAKCVKPDVVFDHRVDLEDRGIYAVDPCNCELAYPQPRVVIVGAGMAGISAAARLAERGITNFVVLEAYERPGGRIYSCWLGDIVAELGSHWKQDNYQNHPVFQMTAAEDPPRPGAPAAEHTRSLFQRVTAGKTPYPSIISAYYKFRQIEEEAATIYCHGGSKQHGSLVNFMSIRIQQELHEYPEEQQHDAARIMFGMLHMLTARCGCDTSMLCCDHMGCFVNFPGGAVRVPLGLIGVVAPLLRQIPQGNIRYCKPVNCIYWGTCPKTGYRATVTCGDGEEFPADYVIITVSLGVLRQNAAKLFCPALPSSKMDAMRCLGYGCCDKIYLEYCRPFWYWQQTELNFNFCSGELSGCCDWTSGITAIEIVPYSKHVLCAWVAGQGAIMMERLCDKDVAEGVTGILRKVTGDCIPYPTSILRSQWFSDPFFCGSYSYECGCSDGRPQLALACPLPGPNEPIPPILLFAGEATVPGHFATVSGARLSGVREAERITQLTLQFKGPPLPNENHEKVSRMEVAVKCEDAN